MSLTFFIGFNMTDESDNIQIIKDLHTLHAGQPPTTIISGTMIAVECVEPYDGT